MAKQKETPMLSGTVYFALQIINDQKVLKCQMQKIIKYFEKENASLAKALNACAKKPIKPSKKPSVRGQAG